jgi:hypothetical protein
MGLKCLSKHVRIVSCDVQNVINQQFRRTQGGKEGFLLVVMPTTCNKQKPNKLEKEEVAFDWSGIVFVANNGAAQINCRSTQGRSSARYS